MTQILTHETYYDKEFIRNATQEQLHLLGLDKLDAVQFSHDYFSKLLTETSIDPNANVGGISPNNYLSEIAKPYAKYVFFQKLYEKGHEMNTDFTLEHIWNGSIYIHDATKLQPYCFGVSATEIATEGRPYSSLPAAAPKRLGSFMGQTTEFIMDCSQEFAGAIAVTDLVPWMAWFIEKDGPKRQIDEIPELIRIRYHEVLYPYTDKEIENVFQSFVHVLNNNFRVGGDSPFTNISINSKQVYYDIFDHYVFPDGKTIDDLWETIKRVQKIIIDFMAKGRPDGLPYRFPILTANFKADPSELESEWFKYVTEHNAKGFMNMNFAERFSMCCRLQLDLSFKQNSFGGGGVKIGSMRVANLNLPRIAYKSKYESTVINGKRNPSSNEEIFFSELSDYIDRAMEYLVAYSKIFKEMIDVGYLKFFREPSKWFNMNMFFATVGFCGIWDCAEIMYREPLYVRSSFGVFDPNKKTLLEKRVDFMEKIIDMMVEKTKEKSNGIKFNVEEVPSESAAGRMAKFNTLDYGEEKEYYSNQFLPLNMDIPLHKRIEIESRLQSKLTGGGMTFLNFDAELTPEQSYEIHKHMLETGFTGQFCINYGYTHCPNCSDTIMGKQEGLCDCGFERDFYTRVVGYLAKQSDTATTKSLEIDERSNYSKL